MQTSATTMQKEKLATILFEQKVTLKALGVDDEGVKAHDMVPFAQRFKKPKDDRIKTRQMKFPGAPTTRPVRMPIEVRKRWGGTDYLQTYLVDDVVSGHGWRYILVEKHGCDNVKHTLIPSSTIPSSTMETDSNLRFPLACHRPFATGSSGTWFGNAHA
jgi:hypothetical protein